MITGGLGHTLQKSQTKWHDRLGNMLYSIILESVPLCQIFRKMWKFEFWQTLHTKRLFEKKEKCYSEAKV